MKDKFKITKINEYVTTAIQQKGFNIFLKMKYINIDKIHKRYIYKYHKILEKFKLEIDKQKNNIQIEKTADDVKLKSLYKKLHSYFEIYFIVFEREIEFCKRMKRCKKEVDKLMFEIMTEINKIKNIKSDVYVEINEDGQIIGNTKIYNQLKNIVEGREK